MIDFINMKEESHNHELMKNLAEYVRTDPVRTTVVDMTKLGLVELTRQKETCIARGIFRNQIG